MFKYLDRMTPQSHKPGPMAGINPMALLAWAAGTAFLVPSLKEGLQEAFGLHGDNGSYLAWSGAIAVSLIGPAGAMVAASVRLRNWYDVKGHAKILTGRIIAIGGLILAIGASGAGLWNRVQHTHVAPTIQASSGVAPIQAELDANRARAQRLREDLSVAMATMKREAPPAGEEGRTMRTPGAYPKWREAQARCEALSIEIADLDAQAPEIRSRLANQSAVAANTSADAYWLATEDWGKWAILAFDALFETMLVLLAGMAVHPPRIVRKPRRAPSKSKSKTKPKTKAKVKGGPARRTRQSRATRSLNRLAHEQDSLLN